MNLPDRHHRGSHSTDGQLTSMFVLLRKQVAQLSAGAAQELILKVRVAGSDDADYIEVEMQGDTLTLENLAVVAAEELGVETSQVERVRKMPNTRLRRDKEVARLTDYQEVELVMKGAEHMQ